MRLISPSSIALLASLLVYPLVVAASNKPLYLELARRGWTYDLRTPPTVGHADIPTEINGRRFSGAYLCIIGERPHPATRKTIDAFRKLMRDVYGRPLLLRYAGRDAGGCGTGRVVILRLYSGYPPNREFAADLRWMDRQYSLDLPLRHGIAVTTPAMAQTFFGRRGQGTHILVQQPGAQQVGPLERTFFRSILVEELYQSFTFGMDILLFDRSQPFLSKLQETPINLTRLPWASSAFMKALVQSNPYALCAFDVFMLHAVAHSPVGQTNESAFIDYIEADFDVLTDLANDTLRDPAVAPILDPGCARWQD